MAYTKTDIEAAVERFLLFENGVTTYRMDWRIVHKPTQTELATGSVQQSVRVADPGIVAAMRDRLMARVLFWRDAVREQWAERAALDDNAMIEAGPWMDGWEHVPLTAERWFKLYHPVSGETWNVEFPENRVNAQNWPTEKGLYDKLGERCLAGPVWCMASSPAAGELDLACAAVSGAVSYQWYDMTTRVLLASSSVETASETGLSAGTYDVRACGLTATGTVGLLSRGAEVVVS